MSPSIPLGCTSLLRQHVRRSCATIARDFACPEPASIGTGAARVGNPPDELLARIQELEIIDNKRIVGFALVGLEESLAGIGKIPAQHVGIALVVEELRGLAGEPDGTSVGAIGEIEAGEPIVGGRQPYPGGRVARGLFD